MNNTLVMFSINVITDSTSNSHIIVVLEKCIFLFIFNSGHCLREDTYVLS